MTKSRMTDKLSFSIKGTNWEVSVWTDMLSFKNSFENKRYATICTIFKKLERFRMVTGKSVLTVFYLPRGD